MGLRQAGEKPKISPTSWAWAGQDPPTPPPKPSQISESMSVCRNSLLCLGHCRQNRSTGARLGKGCSSQQGCGFPCGAPPVLQGQARGKGEPLPFPLSFSVLLPLLLPHSPSRSAASGTVARGSSECRPGPAGQDKPNPGQRPGQAPSWSIGGGATRKPYLHPLYPVPASFLTLPEFPPLVTTSKERALS